MAMYVYRPLRTLGEKKIKTDDMQKNAACILTVDKWNMDFIFIMDTKMDYRQAHFFKES